MFNYNGGFYGAKQWQDVEPVDRYITQASVAALDLPQELLVRYFRTQPMGLFPTGKNLFDDANSYLEWVNLGFMSDLESHITLVEGSMPLAADPADGSEVEVLVSESMATDLGLQVGEIYTLFTRDTLDTGEEVITEIPVQISGVWRASDPLETYWFSSPNILHDVLLVPEETFLQRISPILPDEVYSGFWYLVMDGDGVRANDAASMLRRIASFENKADELLPETKLFDSPVQALRDYQRSSGLLTVLLYAFSIPLIGLVLAFISLVAGLSIEGRRNEIAILRSRGATTMQIIAMVILEGLVLGVAALAISLPLAIGITQVIGQTRSFLDFSSGSDLNISFTQTTIRAGLIAIALALVAQVMPAIGASRHTIVSYKRERARMQGKPLWKRMWLDVLLLIAAAYGAYLLRQQGSIALLESSMGDDPLQNPLLLLVPALGVLAFTLLFLRLMPYLMAGIAWFASRSKSVGLLLAARHLSRTPGYYTTPLILLVVTLSLATFTASLAQALDIHLHDQIYYTVGADMRFNEPGQRKSTGFGLSMGMGETEATETVNEGPIYLFIPASEYLKAPGVRGAARVGRYPAIVTLGDGSQNGLFFGVDRYELPQVAFWRPDFGSDSLGDLMNALAVTPDGVLAPRSFMRNHALNTGDIIRLTVDTFGSRNVLPLKIVGAFDLFPTWYPEQDGPLFIGNLDYLFENVGAQYPYRIWLKTDQDVNFQQLGDEQLRDFNVSVLTWTAAPEEISNTQQQPERQGLFGLLSVGFIAAAVLTVLGFLLYALYSFRRRFIEIGVLRATGLSSGQMTSFLGWELAFLILIGVGLGTTLGIWISATFIPYLQIGTSEVDRIPPFVIEIAWPAIFQVYILFALIFVTGLVVLVLLLRRMRIFEAIKLGETV
jgi:putative ABC transport system permease protein